MTDWENIISFENLYKAHRKARLGKRHKKEVIEFEMNLAENLWTLHYDLKYGRYVIIGYHNFMIYDPKKREIQAITYRDRIVQHSLCDNYLIPLLEKHLIYANVACRKQKGTGLAIALVRKYMLQHYKKYKKSGYFVKLDVKKYFENIDHNILKEKLNKVISSADILKLIDIIIDSYCHHTNCGLPMGNQSSQCFALLYLDKTDRYYKEIMNIRFYVRYMDDIVMIVKTKEQAVKALSEAGFLFQKERIMLNPKSQIIPIKNGIGFLGWNFKITDTGKISQHIRQASRNRILKNVKSIIYHYKGALKSDRIAASLVSYKGHIFKKNYCFFCHIKNVMCI